jgi:hypothetical protein
MEKLFELVLKLEENRKIPQLLFYDEIRGKSMQKLRSSVIEYRLADPDIKEIDLILDSPGGSPGDAYRIIRTLRSNFDKVNVVIPFWAKSAATLITLGGTSIIMDEFGELGPLDVQIAKERDDNFDYDRESALNDEYSLRTIETQAQLQFMDIFVNLHSSKYVPINKNELSRQIFEYLANFYEPVLSQINPYKLGDKKRKLKIGEDYATRILLLYNSISENKRRRLVDYLVNDCPEHGFIIDYELISKYLDNVHKSSNFGKDYEIILREIASFFIEETEPNEYIGFVKHEKDKETKKQEETLES